MSYVMLVIRIEGIQLKAVKKSNNELTINSN